MEVSLVEVAVLIGLRSIPVVCVGLAIQFFLLRKRAFRARVVGSLILMNAVIALVVAIAACYLYVPFVQDLITMDLASALAFAPAWIGVLLALAVVQIGMKIKGASPRPD